jgi:hypothetical protein
MSPLDLKSPPDASVTTLVSGIIHDAQQLVKQQFELFKHELRNDVRKTQEASLTMGTGALVSLVAVILLSLMLVELLKWAVPTLPLWGCYGIFGLAYLVVGASLIYSGKLKFESMHPMPDESVQALKENVQWITNRK